jgi:hypothetical protein
LSVVFVSKAVSGGTDDVFTSSSTGAWTWIALVDGGFYAAVRAGGTQGSYGASGPGYTRNLWQIHTAVFNGASSRGSINGDPDDTFSVGTDALEYGLQIGINLLFTADRMDGDIAEIAFINGALTTAEEQTWQGYFAWKYGLVGNLPSGHPYKTTHPGFAVIAREPVPVSAASGAALAPTLPLTAPVAAASAAIPTVVERAIAQVPVSAATAAFLTPNVLVASFVIAPVLAANGAWLSLILPLMASAMTATGAMATPTMRDIEAAPVLAGTAAALTPTMRDIETAPVAAATGAALVPVVPLTVPAAQASGAVPAVTEQAIEIVPASQATGAALTPTMRAIESLPALAATGASLVPTLPLILPTLAATGVLLTPSLGGALILGVPVLPATAAALTPTMRAIAQVPAAQAGARMVKPWTPTVYSGSQLIRWLDASQESATDGATLTVGRDWSPNHVDFTGEPLATDGPHLGVAPTFHTNVQNGLPAYHFAETSVGVYFKTGPLSALASQPMSVIFVAKPAAVSPGFNWEDVWTAIDGSSTPSATPAVTRDGGGDWLLITKDAGSENITIGHNDAADWQVVAAVVNGATSKGSLDGTIVTGTTRTTVNLGDGILIGFDYVFPENLFQGDIGEVIIAAGAWTDSDLDILNGYLHHKWGLAARLPSTHPYKANPPTIADQVAVLARSVVPAMPAAGAVLTPTMVARQGVPVAPATASVLTPMFPLLAPVLSATGVLLAPTSGGQLLLTVPLLTAAGALLAPMLPWNVTVAAATGSALVPSFPLVAPAMSATGAVPAVTERAIEQAAILAATGAFLTPSLTGQLTVTAPVLAATGAALAPAFPLLASVLTASGAVPALTLPRIAPVLSASGTWLDATARVTETAPALTASGAFLLPGVAEQVAAPILSASGAALAPTLPTTQRFDVELLAAGAGLVPPSLAAIAAMPVLTATAGMLVPFFSGRMYLDIPALTATAALLAASTMTPLPVPILSASGDAHAPGILVVVRATILGATGDLLAVGIPVAFALRLPSDLRAPVSRVAATAPVIAVLGVPVRQTNGHAPAAETLEVPTMILDGTAPRS